MYQYKIKKITKIVDGDTIDVDIDLGFDITINQRVRLKGVNAPESRSTNEEEKKKGLAAKEWLKKELSQPNEWMIQTEKDKEEKYGRILGTLYLIDNKISLNQKMLNEGIVVAYDGGKR